MPKLEKKLPVTLSVGQVEELLTAPLKAARESRAPAWAATRDSAILELLYGSGLRLSELVALDVTNLDLLDQTVRVLGKGQKERIVQVGRPALEAIHAYRIQAHVREGPLFLNKRRTRISGHSVERIAAKISFRYLDQASSEPTHPSALLRDTLAG